jgi:hypothetical protein
VSYRRDLGRVLLLREEVRGILECKTYSGASTSVAGKRLVWTENPSACATVDCKVSEREIKLYSLCISVIKSECVTNC